MSQGSFQLHQRRSMRPSFAVCLLASASVLLAATPARAFDNIGGLMLETLSSPYALTMSQTTLAIATDDNQGLFHVSNADVGTGAENFINNMAKRGLDFLGDASMPHDQKKESFRKLLQDSFDLETIGRFVLGRYWKTATAQQRTEYQQLFRKMVADVYATRFGDYDGQKFETRGHRGDGEKDTIVTSYIVPSNGPEIQIDWRVRYKNGGYKVVDVIVEGVSMSVTQRSDFSAVIQRGGGDMQVLLAHLRK